MGLFYTNAYLLSILSPGAISVKSAGSITGTTVTFKLMGSLAKYNRIVFSWCSLILMFSILMTGSV